MSTTKLIKAIYPKVTVPQDNPESYYLLRLANLYGEEVLEELSK
ncbi:MAG TPA: ribonucleotide-diphosphate reductase subunit beta [Cyanothece sp. UBA12306]|nr:ribonucleotide-diphosphate reductase subunit beta [Cyanothece sp. UBA12306]